MGAVWDEGSKLCSAGTEFPGGLEPAAGFVTLLKRRCDDPRRPRCAFRRRTGGTYNNPVYQVRCPPSRSFETLWPPYRTPLA